MKLPLEWLKEYGEVPQDDRLQQLLTGAGVGVESIENGILDVEITPNRGDWLSVVGLAREIAAMSGKPLPRVKEGISLSGLKPEISVRTDPRLCPCYGAVIVDGVSTRTSSPEVQNRLKAAGIRPINAIVDATNYLMLETGQPFHAFDLDKIHGKEVTIRSAKQGEKLITLDGKERALPEDAIVISDAERIIDLVGIMGGGNSAVDEKTARVLLQAAIFDPVLIRRASKKIGLRTEASYRYERGLDWNIEPVLSYGAKLMAEVAGGKVTGTVIIGELPTRLAITLSVSEIDRLLRMKITAKEAADALRRLGFAVKESGTTLHVTIPTWRNDVSIPEDLIEEVARVIGYEKIPKKEMSKGPAPKDQKWTGFEKVKEWLAREGFQEVLTYPLVSKQDVGKGAVEIANPLSPSQQYFRTSILPGLLRVAAKNSAVADLRIFEVGHIAAGKKEEDRVAVLAVGKKPQLMPFRKADAKILSAYKIRKEGVWIWEGTIDEVVKDASKVGELTSARRFTVKPLPKFPASVRDLSIVVPESAENNAVLTAIQDASPIVFAVEIFDEFTSDKFGKEMKSLAFHITYQSNERTLTDKEVNESHKAVEDALKKQFAAKVRGVDIP
jgi:phenylalanyl-tRNA synthetase beta chain